MPRRTKRRKAPTFAPSAKGTAPEDPTTTGFPSLYQNDYLYAAFCSGCIRSFDPTTKTEAPFASGIVKSVNLKVGENGGHCYLLTGSISVSAFVREVRFAGG